MLRISTYCLSDVCFFANTIRTPEGAVSDSLNIIDTNARCAFTRENMLQNESNIRKHTQHNIVTSHVGESHTRTSSVSLRPWLTDFGFTFQMFEIEFKLRWQTELMVSISKVREIDFKLVSRSTLIEQISNLTIICAHTLNLQLVCAQTIVPCP